MHVTLGPVASVSVVAWVHDARVVLADTATEPVHPGEDGVWLPTDVIENFSQYLDAWEAAAVEETFRWEGDVSAEQAEYLMHAFFRLAHHFSSTLEARGHRVMSPEGDDFYRSLVTAMVVALEQEGSSSSEFSQHLRSFWPGIFDDS